MSDLPSMPLFVDDYEAATAHLTLEEDGAYNRLLRLCWRTPSCSIPDDPQWIARRLRVDDATFARAVAPVIDEYFTREDGRIWQKRQRQEWAYVTELRARRREAGSAGGKAKALNRRDIDPTKANVLLVANGKQTSSKPLATAGTAPDQKCAKTKALEHNDFHPSKALAPTPTPTPTPTPSKEDTSLREDAPASVSRASPVGETDEQRLFRRAREIIGGKPGGLVTKLRKACEYDDAYALTILEQSADKDRPAEWLGGVLRNHNPDDEIYRGAVGWDGPPRSPIRSRAEREWKAREAEIYAGAI